MAKKKKESFLWAAIKFIFVGIFKLIWWIIKGIGLGIYWIFAKIFGATSKKLAERRERKKLENNPTYGKKAMFDPLPVLSTVSGDYSVSEKRLHNDSIIALIFGKRGSGKSALGFRLLENAHSETGRECFVLGVSQSSMPEWIKPVESIEDAPQGSIVLVDEGAISFNSRDSMRKENKGLAHLLAIARHKNLTILFITQNTGMLDKNVLKLSDMLLVKQGSLLQLEMERPEIRKFYEKAEELFKKLEGDKRQYVYVIDSDFEGAVSHTLPSFWTENLSKNQAEEKV